MTTKFVYHVQMRASDFLQVEVVVNSDKTPSEEEVQKLAIEEFKSEFSRGYDEIEADQVELVTTYKGE